MALSILSICHHCRGTGIYQELTSEVDPCPFCEGTKTRPSTSFVDDQALSDSISAVTTTLTATQVSIARCPTSILLENTDSTEYLALNADKKAIYNLFISAGTLDLSVGKNARNIILGWIFPQGTTTNSNITSALAP